MSQFVFDNSVSDIGDAINQTLRDSFLRQGAGFTSWGGSSIELQDGEYSLTTPIKIENEVNATISACSPWSVLLNNETGQDKAIHVKGSSGVGQVAKLENLVLRGGQVCVSGKRRGKTLLECLKVVEFENGPGIYFVGDEDKLGPTRYKIKDCQVVRCAGGIWIEAKTFNLGRIEGGAIVASTDTSLRISGDGVRITDVDFSASSGHAYVHIDGNYARTSSIDVEHCRFGSEDVGSNEQQVIPRPKHDVIIGSADGSPSSNSINTLRFQSNTHSGGRPEHFADSAFKVNTKASRVRISGSHFAKNYKKCLVDNQGQPSFDSLFADDNTIQRKAPEIFSGTIWSKQ